MASVFPRKPKAEMAKPTPAQRAQAEMTIKKARVQLVLNHPFFATLLMKAKVTLDDKLPTACVNAHGHIKVGTGFATTITVSQAMFVLAHEVMHPALAHFSRRGSRNPHGWNVAGDKTINDMLVQAGMTKVEGCIYQPGASAFYAEELYQQDPEGSGSGQGADGADGAYEPGNGLDDMDQTPMDEASQRECEETWRVNMAQAKTIAKQQGKMPGSLERLVDSIINPVTPWFTLLERLMTNFIKADYSWSRPNKRHIGAGLYLPSSGKQPSMGTVVIQSDESGSISPTELEHFAGHISKIIETCRPEKVIVLHTDTHVHKHVDEFTMDDLPLRFKSYAGGGTDMRAGFQWIEEHGVDPEVCITLTDGFSPWPDKPTPYPAVILCTTDTPVPFGEVIRYSVV